MKDKEKQIVEMANIIKAVKYEPFNDGKPTYTVGNQMQDFVFDLIAEELIKQGYQKVDKDSVVLSREEYEILTKDIEHPTDEVLKKLVVGKNLLTEQVIEKTRKEMAEKILEKARNFNNDSFILR